MLNAWGCLFLFSLCFFSWFHQLLSLWHRKSQWKAFRVSFRHAYCCTHNQHSHTRIQRERERENAESFQCPLTETFFVSTDGRWKNNNTNWVDISHRILSKILFFFQIFSWIKTRLLCNFSFFSKTNGCRL